jgi:hypothetical protein
MRSYIAAFVLICGALGGIAVLAAGGDDAGEASDLEGLKQQVKALEQRVAALEKRLGQGPTPRVFPMPSPRLPDRQVPKDWLPREFNGVPYYIIPIQNEPNRPIAPTK